MSGWAEMTTRWRKRLHAEVEADVEVEAVGAFTLKGFRRPVTAFNIVTVREPTAQVNR